MLTFVSKCSFPGSWNAVAEILPNNTPPPGRSRNTVNVMSMAVSLSLFYTLAYVINNTVELSQFCAHFQWPWLSPSLKTTNLHKFRN